VQHFVGCTIGGIHFVGLGYISFFPFHCLVITLLQYVKGNVHVLRQTPIFDLHKGVIRIF
jgi:hypothetical protein